MLQPPIPPPAKPMRCEFKFKAHWQCDEPGEWCAPLMSDQGEFRWGIYCDIHKRDFMELLPGIPDVWQKLRDEPKGK